MDKVSKHLYREGASNKMLKQFKERYGTSCVKVDGRCIPKYKYVYGATVAKIKRNYGY